MYHSISILMLLFYLTSMRFFFNFIKVGIWWRHLWYICGIYWKLSFRKHHGGKLSCSIDFLPFLLNQYFLFVPIADMDSNTSTTLFPLHRCKTLHLVCANSISFCYLLVQQNLDQSILKIAFVPTSTYWMLLCPGEACTRDSQCWRRKESWCIHVSRSFWCTPYSPRLGTGNCW